MDINTFQILQFAAISFIALIAGMLGLFFLSFPALAIVSAVQLSQRRRRNQRDRWARQRTLERAVTGVAAASHDDGDDVPPVSDYPDPEEDNGQLGFVQLP